MNQHIDFPIEMDRNHDGSGTFPFQEHVNDFGLIDFMDEAIFDQFVGLIRGEDVADSTINSNILGYGGDQHSICCAALADSQLFSPAPPGELFDFDIPMNPIDSNNNNYALNASVEEAEAEAVEEIMDGEDSSATITTTMAVTGKKKSNKVDRSRTLISERKRRGRMKEKLYALRSLVPNITKMDKASIVGDAVLYLQDLQMQHKKLKSEVADLESSFTKQDNKYQVKTIQDSQKMDATNFYPMVQKISKINVFQVEERGFYVKVVSNKDKGVAVLLYRALESIQNFHVQSSNLAAFADNYVLTFTIHIKERELDMNMSDLKLWIAGTFLDQGFDFEASVFDSSYF